MLDAFRNTMERITCHHRWEEGPETESGVKLFICKRCGRVRRIFKNG